MKPSEHDVVESYQWLIGTIDGTMRATGRSKWRYTRGFESIGCAAPGGGEGFQFSWMADSDGTGDSQKAAQSAAAYFRSRGFPAEAGQFKYLQGAAYKDEKTGLYVQYMDGGRGVVTVSTTCKPGNATKADDLRDELIKQGKLAMPKNFDPNA